MKVIVMKHVCKKGRGRGRERRERGRERQREAVHSLVAYER
jgi:hypothetical protein